METARLIFADYFKKGYLFSNFFSCSEVKCCAEQCPVSPEIKNKKEHRWAILN